MEEQIQICNWCKHDWHDEECWCYCQAATSAPEPEYCDECEEAFSAGDIIHVYEKLPFETTIAEKGEPGIICERCHDRLVRANG